MIAPSTAAIAPSTLTLNEISTTSPPCLYSPALLSNPTASLNVSSHSPFPSTEFIHANPPSNQLDQCTNSPVSELDDFSRCCFRAFSDPSFSPYGIPAPQKLSTLTEMEPQHLIDTRYATQQSSWPQFYTAPVSWAFGQAQPTQQNMNSLAHPRDEQPLVDYDKWLVQ
ncbi:hypothetical protein PHLGIDRAFT_353798 [Phlebiopsis gigantea 11061_1 CR5-6]|uniref:Uncharacterized protein n=1 Tax=Phlebiopsis gigantea (strain 11061_1 CR5-6) TaxID=745531 RepID=A0A0C3SCL7_PHLG1|nr:hypothetical protein PHLGIDRAFT_353798 [Phlebiopsis gigantea 11061_1 CR5-6]